MVAPAVGALVPPVDGGSEGVGLAGGVGLVVGAGLVGGAELVVGVGLAGGAVVLLGGVPSAPFPGLAGWLAGAMGTRPVPPDPVPPDPVRGLLVAARL